MLCPFLVAPLVGTLGVSCHWQVGLNPQQGSSFGGGFSHMRHCKTAEQGSMLISYSFWCVSFILHPHRQAHHTVSKTENVYTEKADRLEL